METLIYIGLNAEVMARLYRVFYLLLHTGQSWGDWGVLSVVYTNGVVLVRIGVVSTEVEKWQHNQKRYGKFDKNTPDEKARLRADLKQGYRNAITRVRS